MPKGTKLLYIHIASLGSFPSMARYNNTVDANNRWVASVSLVSQVPIESRVETLSGPGYPVDIGSVSEAVVL